MKWFNKAIDFLVKTKLEPTDIRRYETEQEANKVLEKSKDPANYIICGGNKISIDWDKVVTHEDVDGLTLPKNCYKTVKNERVPSMFVAHWDVCLSSKSCYNVLKKRKLSVHFLIDNDGTIYQLMDCNHIGFHAGNRKVNNSSVGVEISNAYYPKYQNIYRSRGFGPRPTWKGVKVHGNTLEPFLGFYDVQRSAFKALVKALHQAYGIPLETPTRDEKIIKTQVPAVTLGSYKGVVNHYHVTTRKIDCAGFDIDNILKEIS
jgi:hypothetical protein